MNLAGEGKWFSSGCMDWGIQVFARTTEGIKDLLGYGIEYQYTTHIQEQSGYTCKYTCTETDANIERKTESEDKVCMNRQATTAQIRIYKAKDPSPNAQANRG